VRHTWRSWWTARAADLSSLAVQWVEWTSRRLPQSTPMLSTKYVITLTYTLQSCHWPGMSGKTRIVRDCFHSHREMMCHVIHIMWSVLLEFCMGFMIHTHPHHDHFILISTLNPQICTHSHPLLAKCNPIPPYPHKNDPCCKHFNIWHLWLYISLVLLHYRKSLCWLVCKAPSLPSHKLHITVTLKCSLFHWLVSCRRVVKLLSSSWTNWCASHTVIFARLFSLPQYSHVLKPTPHTHGAVATSHLHTCRKPL